MSGQVMVLVDEGIQFACPVDVKILCEQSLQVVHENPVAYLPVAGGMGYTGVVCTRRDLDAGFFQSPADRLDAEGIFMAGDVADVH